MTQKDDTAMRELVARSIGEIRGLRERVQELETARHEPTAVVGMANRFPGSSTPNEYWEFLAGGRDGIQAIPRDRWDLAKYFSEYPAAPGRMYTAKGGFLDDVAGFDAGMFEVSPREAMSMDPQQRLLLEVSWHAIEHAGQSIESLREVRTGVYVGVSGRDYSQRMLEDGADNLDMYYLTGNLPCFVPGRVAYFMGFSGPALAIDTACSSSLMAIHQACGDLRSGRCDAALAGGVNLILVPEWNVVLSQAKAMSKDGYCKTFDAAADGYVRGEGCAVVVLKRLSDALRDKDPVLAVIRGGAANQDGRGGGLTVPNGAAQRRVIREALGDARLRPEEVDYVEAHGTGTKLGDPIEMQALEVYGQGRKVSEPLLVGSVKTNFGHLESAAGVAAFIKTVLAIQCGKVPPNLHLKEVNPEIDLSAIPAVVPTRLVEWPDRGDRPRRAGVSSFGASGTNVHLILEEAPRELRDAPRQGDPDLLVLSARSEKALRSLATAYEEDLATGSKPPLADLCYSLRARGAHMPHRLAVVSADVSGVRAGLQAASSGAPHPGLWLGKVRRGRAPKVAFVFSGQGSQYPSMGRELFECFRVFRDVVEECDQLVRPWLPGGLIDHLYGGADLSELTKTKVTQPALFAVECALARLWMAAGIEPAIVLGHSLGEYAAAVIAGVMELPAGLRLVAERGRLMSQLAGDGAMAAVAAPQDLVQKVLSEHDSRVSIAAINGPEATVISGERRELSRVLAALAGRAVKCKELSVSNAFHSAQMDGMLDEFQGLTENIVVSEPAIPFVSNLTGKIASSELRERDYWRRHVREPVRFGSGVQCLRDEGCTVVVEIGPKPSLLALTKAQLKGGEVSFVPSMRPGEDSALTFAQGRAELFCLGIAPRELDHCGGSQPRAVPLLPYPFERKRYWYAQSGSRSASPRPAKGGGAGVSSAAPVRVSSPLEVLQFESLLDLERLPYLRDFVIDGLNIVNIGVYLRMIMAAAARTTDGQAIALKDFALLKAIVLGDQPVRVQVALTEAAHGYSVDVYGRPEGRDEDEPWSLHCRGKVIRRDTPGEVGEAFVLNEWLASPHEEQDGEAFYGQLSRRSIQLGPSGMWLSKIWTRTDDAVAAVRGVQASERADCDGGIHPGILDAGFQVAYSLLSDGPQPQKFMLGGIGAVERLSDGPVAFCRARIKRRTIDEGDGLLRKFVADVGMFDEHGSPVLSMRDALMARTEGSALKAAQRRTGVLNRAGARPALETVRPDDGAPALQDLDDTGRLRLILASVREVLATVLRVSSQQVDPEEGLLALGLDSLMAVELKDGIESVTGVEVSMLSLLEGPTVMELCEDIARECSTSRGRHDEVRPGPLPTTSTEPSAARNQGQLVPDAENVGQPFPLTELQQAYWVGRGGSYDLGGVATAFLVEVDLDDLDIRALQRSWNRVVARHDMLRAVITADGRNRILASVPEYLIRVSDLRGMKTADQDDALAVTRESMRSAVARAETWPMFHIQVSRLSPERSRLHVSMDAMMGDAWSTSTIFGEWLAFFRNPELQLAPLQISFRDYVLAMERRKDGAKYTQARKYWLERLDSLPAAPQLPVDAAALGTRRPPFSHRNVRLGPDAWRRFKKHAARAQVTPSVAMCAAYCEVLAAWSESRRFSLNVLYFNRLPLHPEVSKLVGNFSSTVLVEVDARQRLPFVELAHQIREQMATDLEHSAFSGVEVLRELNRRRGDHSQAVMPVVFASTLRASSKESSFGGLTKYLLQMGSNACEHHASIQTPQVWLDHQVIEDGGELLINWDVVEDLFAPGIVQSMFEGYCRLVSRLAEDGDCWEQVASPGLVSEEELRPRNVANSTDSVLAPKTLHGGFVRRANQQPQVCAVVGVDLSLSYHELDRWSAQLARELVVANARANELVAVVMSKNVRQVVAALGILRSGAAYLPIDAALPQQRIRHLLKHGQVRLAVTTAEVDAAFDWPDTIERFVVEDLPGNVEGEEPHAQDRAAATDLAYVIYTSGSTGQPKGVAIEHGAAMNTIEDVNARFEVDRHDRVLGISSLSFDLSVWDVFGTLAAGGTLVLPDAGLMQDPGHWVGLVERHQVTVWNSVPALMQLAVGWAKGNGATLHSLRLVMMSGDWIPVALPGEISAISSGARVVSLGGATEASIWSIFHEIRKVEDGWRSIPYGRPLGNQRMHVLDDGLDNRPTMVRGEIYIGGDGLARGYWRDDRRTQASFFYHPRTGERLYRTGDLGRYMVNGEIEFLGREDGQVKIQGYRIELGEIETVLESLSGIERAVALTVGRGPQGKRLVAYIAGRNGAEADVQCIRDQLEAILPSYMVPSRIVPLAELPLTGNGKIDRNALESMGGVEGHPDRPKEVAKGETETIVAQMYSELLGVGDVYRDDTFFELGGQSFVAMQLMTRVRASFGIDVPMSVLFSHGSVADFSDYLESRGEERSYEPLVKVQAGDGTSPLFLVHPVGGNVICYRELSQHLGESQTVMGIEARGLLEGTLPCESIQEMAGLYVERVRRFQPDGPYSLGGWSLGGVVAYEMAQQLRQDGQVVQDLVLIDSAIPSPGGGDLAEASLIVEFARDLARTTSSSFDTGCVAEAPPGERLERLLGSMQAAGVAPAGFELASLRRMQAVHASGLRALSRYQVREYDGRLLAVRAQHGFAAGGRQGWVRFAPRAVEVCVDADHYSVLIEPAVRDVARQIARQRGEPTGPRRGHKQGDAWAPRLDHR